MKQAAKDVLPMLTLTEAIFTAKANSPERGFLLGTIISEEFYRHLSGDSEGAFFMEIQE